ncbi:MAG: ATP-binding protein [Fulvivirga sp.]|uniref:ATP-binding protein n=1 Tax=Fulvivirga sp. TaxID=1931237 RepID=UPI0032EAAE38
MTTKEQEHTEAIKKVIDTTFLPRFSQRIDTHKEFIARSYELIQNLNQSDLSKPEGLRLAHRYKASMLESTKNVIQAGLKEFHEEFKHFDKEFDEYLKSQVKTKKLVQKKERFVIQPDDGLLVKILKPFKNAIYLISKWPEKIANVFRKIRGREQVALKPWYHRINYQDLTRYYFKEKFLESITPAIDHYYQDVTSTSLTLWHFDEQIDLYLSGHIDLGSHVETERAKEIDIEEALEKLEGTKKSVKEVIDSVFQECTEAFLINLERVGTIECANRKFSQSRSNKLQKRNASNFNRSNNRWTNTLLVLNDDWQIDLELYDIIYESLYKLIGIKSLLKDKLDSIYTDKFDEIKSYLTEWKLNISKAEDSAFKKLIEKDLPAINSELAKLIDQACDYIIDQEFLETIDSLEQLTVHSLEKISQRRAVTRGVDFNAPVKSSQINYISPSELIQFETAPQFFKVTEAMKVATNESLSKTEGTLLQMGQILAFNLETAVAKADLKKNVAEARSIASEGIDRTITQLDNAREHLSKIEKSVHEELNEGLLTYCKNLIKFTNNENILELRVRIAKGKAIEKGRRIKEDIINTIKNFVPIAIRFAKSRYQKYRELFRLKLKSLGIQGVKSNIATEIADFLAETETVIDSLPAVYQRLFRAKPLEDGKFFEGREKEHQQLQNAFKNWKDGRFAASIVVGEKGSGLTTLINLFLFKLNEDFETIRLQPTDNISKEEDFLRYLNEAIGGKKTLALNEFVDYLNKGKKKIIILENIQNLYTKKIGGFVLIKVLAELVSLTHKNAFWITSCTLYAFNFLDKTINFSENFSYTIRMNDLSTEDIINIIERRHKVSGYSLVYEASPDETNNKKYVNLEYNEQQAYLKKNYFNELYKLAKSNISIALVYWLRSTVKGDGNEIRIKSIGNIDYSFINGLSSQKMEVMTLLLLHDGLTEEHVAEITIQSIQKTRHLMHTLLEDGVVIRLGNTYFINPLLYRQTVSLLKAKNIIH